MHIYIDNNEKQDKTSLSVDCNVPGILVTVRDQFPRCCFLYFIIRNLVV